MMTRIGKVFERVIAIPRVEPAVKPQISPVKAPVKEQVKTGDTQSR